MPERRIDDRDNLTGVHARHVLLDNLDLEEHAGKTVYVVLCDLDNFRLINDAYGEDVGNEVLVEIGAITQSVFGDDHVCRFGSDEFLILDAFDDEGSFLEKLRDLDVLVDAVGYGGTPLHLAISHGYAYGEIRDDDDLHEAIRLADRKMYEAKRLGKGRAVGIPLASGVLPGEGYAGDRMYKSYEMDELTGLANLMCFRNRLDDMLAGQRGVEDAAPEDRIAIVYFNIHNFKVYNEKYGFDAGDELLVLIGDAIRDAFPGRLAARFSADHFMAIATADTAEQGVREVRAAFRKRQKTSSIWLKAGIYVPTDEDINVGVNMDRPKIACDSILSRQDVYFCYYDQKLKEEILMHRYVLENFERALDEDWIKVLYQPIIHVATGEVCDAEALARWIDPEQGSIPPDEFIPVLEDARLIHRLDLHMARCVCEDLRATIDGGLPARPVSVNLSPLDFELCDIVTELTGVVDELGIDHGLVAVEVTESTLAGNQEFLKAEIDRFRASGFEVWMDDFGSGYSSLNILKAYEFDLVKVDKGFLQDFDKGEKARVLLSHIIGLVEGLGLKTLVEGVETREQYDFLRSIGCGRAQGSFFGVPSSLEEMLISPRTDPSGLQ